MDIGLLVLKAVQGLFILLDVAVYAIIETLYTIFSAIVSIRLFQTEVSNGETFIQLVAKNVYIFIGIIALFKIVFALIMMITNPDMLTDKQKGGGKLVTKFLLTLILTIAVPFIFNLAYEFQEMAIKQNVVGQILSVGSTDEIDFKEDTSLTTKKVNSGQKVANILFSAFLTRKEEVTGGDCDAAETAFANINSDDANKSGVAKYVGYVNHTGKNNETNKDAFCYSYMWGISTAAGGFAAYVFLIYCLDIAIRVVKLAFLELIAPVPIVSNITSDKDGPFQRWTKTCISTYADLFIRLLIINFIIQIIPSVAKDLVALNIDGGISSSPIIEALAKVAIILGILAFAKQAPQLIKDLFGGKDGGSDYGFGMKKKLEKVPVAGKPISKGVDYVKSAAGSAGSYIKNQALNAGAGLRDKIKKDPDMARNREIRRKATTAEALMRLNPENMKEGKYTGMTRNQLTRQALTGNVNAKPGLVGRAEAKAQDIMSNLEYETAAHKSSAMKASGKIKAGYGNLSNNLDMNFSNLQTQREALLNSKISLQDKIDVEYKPRLHILDNNISEIDRQSIAVDTRLSGIETNLSAIDSSLSNPSITSEERITLNNEKKTLIEERTSLQTEKRTLTEQKTSLQTEKTNLKTEMDSTYTTKVGEVDRQIAAIDSQLAPISTEFNAKAIFEGYVDSIDGLEKTFQNIAPVNSEEWMKTGGIADKMTTGLDAYINDPANGFTIAEKKAITDYAKNKGVTDLDKRVNTLDKKK